MKYEVLSRKSEVGSRKSEVGSQKSEDPLACEQAFSRKQRALFYPKQRACSQAKDPPRLSYYERAIQSIFLT